MLCRFYSFVSYSCVALTFSFEWNKEVLDLLGAASSRKDPGFQCPDVPPSFTKDSDFKCPDLSPNDEFHKGPRLFFLTSGW